MHESVKDVNFERLETLVKHFEEEPRRFNMETWYANVSDHLIEFDEVGINVDHEVHIADNPDELPPCGAIACAAGETCILFGNLQFDATVINGVTVKEYLPPVIGWMKKAAELLDLTSEQSRRLFLPSENFGSTEHEGEYWPEQFWLDYVKADKKEKVQVLRRRIEYFKETGL